MSESCKSDIKLITCIALSNAVFTPRVIIPGVPTAGDNFNIICRLDGVVERLAVTPFAVTLAFSMPPGGMAGNQSRNGSAYIREHILNPLMTSGVGTGTDVTLLQFYRKIADFWLLSSKTYTSKVCSLIILVYS